MSCCGEGDCCENEELVPRMPCEGLQDEGDDDSATGR
jgi:hypothetical protein